MTTKDKIIEKQDDLLRLYESYIQTMNDASRLATIHDSELAQEVWHDAIEIGAKILLSRSELAELKAQDKEVKDEDNSDPMCFHECPMCQTRCNCDTVYCTHCEEEVTDVDIEKYIDTFLNHEVFDIELIGDDMQDNNNLKRTLRHGIRQGAKAMRDGKIKPNK